ncbi:hypothetical protein MRX96_010403 [Rhipicephalus microplus]
MYATEIAAAPRFGDGEDSGGSYSEPPGDLCRALLSAPQSQSAPVRWFGMECTAQPPRGSASQVGWPRDDTENHVLHLA